VAVRCSSQWLGRRTEHRQHQAHASGRSEPILSHPSPEVQTLEAQTAPAAFDRDSTTEHTAYDGGHLIAMLDARPRVRTIKVYGAAPYSLSVDADASGAGRRSPVCKT